MDKNRASSVPTARQLPVFFDPTRRRWSAFLACAGIVGTLVLGPVGVLLARVYDAPEVGGLRLSEPQRQMATIAPTAPGGSEVANLIEPASFPSVEVTVAEPAAPAAVSPSFAMLPAAGADTTSLVRLPPPGNIDDSPSMVVLQAGDAGASPASFVVPAAATMLPLSVPESAHVAPERARLGWIGGLLGGIGRLLISPVHATEFAAPEHPAIVAVDTGDTGAWRSLVNNLETIDILVADWLALADGGTVTARDPQLVANTLELVRDGDAGTQVLPMLSCREDEACRRMLADILVSPAGRTALIGDLVKFLGEHDLPGLVVNLAVGIDERLAPDYRAFADELGGALHARGQVIYHRLPMRGGSVDPAGLAAVADALVVHDGEGVDRSSGALAPQAPYEAAVGAWGEAVPPAKLIFEVANLAHDRMAGVPEPQEISTAEAFRRAAAARARPQLDPTTLNWTFSYRDEQSAAHRVWMLDAVTAFNQLRSALRQQPYGVALGRLGLEDATTWTLLADLPTMSPQQLTRIVAPPQIEHRGSGEVMRVTREAHNGSRRIVPSADRQRIVSAAIERFPATLMLEHWGDTGEKVIALTFDDGPHPVHTPEVLRTLARYDVPATFFPTGHNMLRHPDLVRQMLAAGHEVGNHTFSHANIASIGPELLRLELNATQRIFEGITGRNTLLFRPPYAADTNPERTTEYFPLEAVTGLGYLTVGMNIDPKDWQRPGAGKIVEAVLDGATRGTGKVVLLHDGGGDRSQTVAALPELIERLRAEGFRFVTVSELVGLSSAAVMPPSRSAAGASFLLQRAGMFLVREGERAIGVIFLVAIGLGIARSIILILMSFVRRRRPARTLPPGHSSVAVVVPAHNEAKVVTRTVASLLRSSRRDLEVLVIDDGSTDGTAELCLASFRGNGRVRVVSTANAGKAAALNHGFALTDADVVVAIDADTILLPDAIERLAGHFDDPAVAAVSGNAKVGNRINLLTRWQALEYITSQNLDRRAFEAINCMTVVPGAIGAWRRSAVVEAGGFSPDTLAEDADLTLRLVRRGHRVVYEDQAIALTEAPQTAGQFVVQRFRWMFGMLQVAFKHLGALKLGDSRAVGLVAIPNILLFQVLFPLAAPVADLVALGALFEFAWRWATDSQFPGAGSALLCLGLFAAFVLLDAAAAATAFWHEKTEDWRLLLWLIPQRFYYRPLLYIVAIRATLTAIRGSFVGWGVLQRAASVRVPLDRTAPAPRASV